MPCECGSMCISQEAYDKPTAHHVVGRIKFPKDKPKSHFFIDDRAFRFEGTFPTMEDIRVFKPWNKR